MPQITVIIPYYNGNIEHMTVAINSVFNQTIKDWEIIIVNDGSTLKKSNLLEAYLKTLDDSRLRYYKNTNAGVAVARNFGIDKSNSIYIALLDQDDYWYEDKLKLQLKVFEDYPETSVVSANCDDLFPNSKIVHRKKKTPPNPLEISNGKLFQHMAKSNFIPLVTAIFKKQIILTENGFDKNFGGVEDKELWLRLLISNHKFYWIDDYVAVHRLHEFNESKNIPKVMVDRLRLINKLDSILKNNVQFLEQINWSKLKRSMTNHLYHEVAEGYIEEKNGFKGLYYSLPQYCGFSISSIKLSARAVGKIFNFSS
jgi:glycosyltransferase involved in cell wall biosynthesis